MLSHLTLYKKSLDNIIHYIAVKNNTVIASIDINKTLTGHCWVRHSVSNVSRKGYGIALYKCVMADLYPFGLMPSREVTSGHAVALWGKLWLDTEIIKAPITHESIYFDEADEWIEDVLKVNPLHNEKSIETLENNFSFLEAVKKGKMTPHPYNHTYIGIGVDQPTFKLATLENEHLFIQALTLFHARYEKLDL